MAHYRKVGEVPRTRHTQHPNPDGGLHYEELMGEEGFSGDSSLLYHKAIPSAIVDRLDPSVRDWEGRLALDGGPEGLTLHARLLEQVGSVLVPGGLLALEINDDRGEAALELMRTRLPGAQVDLLRDLFGRDRVVRAIVPLAQERAP